MTFVGRMILPAITLVTFTFVYSCKKDVHEDASSSTLIKTNNLRSASAVSSDGVANLLDDWWANYAVYKNIQYTNSVTPNLNANLNRDYAVSMLHYSLNVAMVNVDSTYQDVTTDSVFYNYTAPPDNPVLLKRDVCIAFDNIKDQIKAKLQNTELLEKVINRITLTDLSVTENSLNLKVNFEATGGTLLATSDPNSGPNVATSFFPTGTSIPWASKQSGQGSSATTNPFYNYWYWLFTGTMPQTLAEKDQGYNMLPPDKPAHKYLSSSQLFWPGYSLLNPGSGMALSCPTGYKFVMSPALTSNGTKTYVEITNKSTVAQDPTDQLTSQDVLSCSNPHKDDLDFNLQDASYILSYDQPEFAYGLTTTRNLDATAMNFYWVGRIPAATAGYNKKLTQMSAKLNTIPQLAGGYYAVTQLVNRVHDNQMTLQVCYALYCGANYYSVCDRQANYVVDTRFDHFTIQPRTPKEFALCCI